MSERLTGISIRTDEAVNIGNIDTIYGHKDWYNANQVFRIETAVSPNGSMVVGWKGASGKLHFTPLTADFHRAGNDALSGDELLHGLEAYDDGFAALTFANSSMYLTRYNRTGGLVFRTQLYVNNGSSRLHTGRVSFYPQGDGGKGAYIVYFGNHSGGHEGDARRLVSAKGVLLPLGSNDWNWGCSHSMDERQAVIKDRIYSLCLSDNYPAAGINLNWNRNTNLVQDVQHYNGFGTGILGGMATHKGFMVVGYASAFQNGDGASRDFWITGFNLQTNKRIARATISNARGVSENRVKIARLGDKLLALWSYEAGPRDRKATMQAMEFEVNFTAAADGTWTMKPAYFGSVETLPVAIDSNADLATLPNGDVVFASAWGDMKDLHVQVISACDHQQ